MHNIKFAKNLRGNNMKKRRKHETPETTHTMDMMDQPNAGAGAEPTPIYDQHYGESDNEEASFTGKKGKLHVSEEYDDSVCVVIDNELYCVEKEEMEGKKKK